MKAKAQENGSNGKASAGERLLNRRVSEVRPAREIEIDPRLARLLLKYDDATIINVLEEYDRAKAEEKEGMQSIVDFEQMSEGEAYRLVRSIRADADRINAANLEVRNAVYTAPVEPSALIAALSLLQRETAAALARILTE